MHKPNVYLSADNSFPGKIVLTSKQGDLAFIAANFPVSAHSGDTVSCLHLFPLPEQDNLIAVKLIFQKEHDPRLLRVFFEGGKPFIDLDKEWVSAKAGQFYNWGDIKIFANGKYYSTNINDKNCRYIPDANQAVRYLLGEIPDEELDTLTEMSGLEKLIYKNEELMKQVESMEKLARENDSLKKRVKSAEESLIPLQQTLVNIKKVCGEHIEANTALVDERTRLLERIAELEKVPQTFWSWIMNRVKRFIGRN